MNLFAQRGAFDKLHGDEVHAAGFTDFMNGRNIRMIERRRSLRFLNETAHAVLVCIKVSGEGFQRDFAIKLCVLGQIHFTHSSSADFGNDAVVRESGIGYEFLVHPIQSHFDRFTLLSWARYTSRIPPAPSWFLIS